MQGKRKHKINKRKMLRSLLILAVLVFIAAGGGKYLLEKIPEKFGALFSAGAEKIFGQDGLNLKTTEVPEYVDVQLLEVGGSRSGRKLEAVRGVVVHYVGNPGTSGQNNHDYFGNPGTKVCSHFVIGLEGEIIQCVPIDERSVASNSRNKDTISIECCHPLEDGKFTDATYDALVKLTAWLCNNSGLSSDDVIRHYDITGKICPKYFVDHEDAWLDFKEDVKSAMKDRANR